MRSLLTLAAVVSACALAAARQPGSGSSSAPDLLARTYREGERVAYHMKASNRGRAKTVTYEVDTEGVVKKDGDEFVEELGWSRLVVNGKEMELPEASRGFRQVLSLQPSANGKRARIPDLTKVHPMLIGPITDLMTFYVDMMVTHREPLARPGDHFYSKYGTPASWADGVNVIVGQDSIDFDVTLSAVDEVGQVATVVVKHVPPQQSQITTPAEWMRTPVADTPNNWVMVTKAGSNKYRAEVGKEVFDVTIHVSLKDGRILSASMHNPVEVVARECSDAALTNCGSPTRFQILRQIDITSRD